MKRLLSSLLVTAALCNVLLPAAEESELEFTEDGFVPLETLFQTTDRAGVTISPNGKHLAGTRWERWRKYRYRLSTFTYDLEDRNITLIHKGMDDTYARWYSFAGDDDLLVRFYHGALYRISPKGDNPEFLISSPNQVRKTNRHLTTSGILDTYPWDPDHILLNTGINGEMIAGVHEKFIKKDLGIDSTISGVWKLNIQTGESEQVIADSHQTATWWLNASGEIALAESWPDMEIQSDGEFEDEHWFEKSERKLYLVSDGQFGKELPLDLGPVAEDSFTQFDFPIFSQSGTKLYYLSQNETDTVSIMSMDLETFETKVVKSDPDGDIVNLIRDPYTYTLIGYKTRTGKGKTVFFDKGLQSIQQLVQNTFPDEYASLSTWDKNYEKFLVFIRGDIWPSKYYLYNRIAGSIEPVFETAPSLNGYSLSRMSVIHFEARDGLHLEGYLTLPANTEAKAPYPLILYVHGGPHSRDNWGYDSMVQFLADRGYAVLQVNFRGSKGYGKSFMESGFKEWGGKMQDDLSDAVKWAIENGHADPERVVIMGASYGGYAAMAGLTFTPELYSAGISMMGRYDLISKIEDLDLYYGDDANWTKDIIRERLGDPIEDAEKLRRTSPIFHVDQIEDPVLITHGKEDKTVRVDQSFEMVRKLKRADKVHEKYYATGVGHSYGWEEKRVLLAEKIEEFLKEHMPSDLMK